MAVGVDMDFAEIVIEMRKKYNVALKCAIPCPNQCSKWSDKDKLRYADILKKSDKVGLISKQYSFDCMLKRNRYMVDKSNLVIAVFNGIEKGGTWYTMQYAKNKPIELIDLREINCENKILS